ncbi:MAG: hypothetical protein VKJ02_13525 [Snowella sp.]|nr:hypothetical protein [Snowella sp.]
MTSRKWWAIFITLTTIEGILLIKLLFAQSLTELLIAIAVIATLLVVTTQITIDKKNVD